MRETAYIYGAGEVTRTPDLLITNQLLYQLSYSGIAGKDSSRAREYSRGRRDSSVAHPHDHVDAVAHRAFGQRRQVAERHLV